MTSKNLGRVIKVEYAKQFRAGYGVMHELRGLGYAANQEYICIYRHLKYSSVGL